MSNITLSKQLVCGVSLAYTVNVWLFSNELDDKLDAGSSCGIAGWGDASVPYGHGLIYSARVYWTPTVCHCVRCQSSPFYLLSDFRSSSKPHCFLLYVFGPGASRPPFAPALPLTWLDCTLSSPSRVYFSSPASRESITNQFHSTLSPVSLSPLSALPPLLWPWRLSSVPCSSGTDAHPWWRSQNHAS